jgi:hypothetical protein
MRLLFIIISILSFSFTSIAQLEQGTWLVGGSGSFYAGKNKFSNDVQVSEFDILNVALNPSLGYFLTENLALGLRLGYIKYKSESVPRGITSNTNRFDFGPFVRYYLLPNDRSFNLLFDAAYKPSLAWFSDTKEKGARNMLSLSAGTVVFFNTSVALEFLIGYYKQGEKIPDMIRMHNRERGLQTTIGLQFHLKK